MNRRLILFSLIWNNASTVKGMNKANGLLMKSTGESCGLSHDTELQIDELAATAPGWVMVKLVEISKTNGK